MDWVTDPAAIFTIIELKGLRAGDEIITQVCAKPDHGHERDSEYTGKVLVIDGIDKDPLHPVDTGGCEWCWCYCAIVAWRRPDGKV